MARLVIEYQGFNPFFDRELETIVGRESGGSGFCTVDNIRDISWNGNSLELRKIANVLESVSFGNVFINKILSIRVWL